MLSPSDLEFVGKRLKAKGYRSLLDYYASPRWKKVRRRMFRKRAYRCFVCGKNHGLQVHHMTYKSLCCERLRHLCWLCDICHVDVHKIAMVRKWTIWRATKWREKLWKKVYGAMKA